MHIAHIIWNIDAIGGAERMVVNIAVGLKKNGIDVSVISICGKGESHYSQRLRQFGIKLIHLYPFICKAFNPEITIKLIKIITKLSPDIIHTHLWGASFHGFLCAKLLHRPIIVHEQNVLLKRKWYWDIFDRLTIWQRSRTIACSFPVYDSLLSKLKLNNKKIEKIVVIENCVDESQLVVNKDRLSMRREIGVDKDDFVFINIASLTEQKGHKYLIEAFSQITEVYKSTRLIIVGGGELIAEIENLIEQKKLASKVRLLRIRKDVPELLNASDVFVLSSLWEGLPIVLLEAMYIGLPVVVTNVGVMKEIVKERVNGLLAEVGNVESLYNKMKFCIENKAEMENMKIKAQNLVKEKYLSKAYINNLMKLYQQIYRWT